MSDIVVTVPKRLWQAWIAEGDLPGQEAEYESHFWIGQGFPSGMFKPGDRVYIVAFDRLRGYAPLVGTEQMCRLNPRMACLIREGGAVAVTIDEPIRGFQGWRKRWWDRERERPYPDWQTDNVTPPSARQPALQDALL